MSDVDFQGGDVRTGGPADDTDMSGESLLAELCEATPLADEILASLDGVSPAAVPVVAQTRAAAAMNSVMLALFKVQSAEQFGSQKKAGDSLIDFA